MYMDGNSKIVFHRFRNTTQPDEFNLYAIVRWDTDETLKVEKESIHLIHLLSEGRTVAQAAKAINVQIGSVIDLLKKFQSAGFIKQIDDELIPDNGKKISPWLADTHRKWFRWILSKPILYSIFLYIIFGISIGFIQQKSFFTYKDFFWTDDLFTVLLSLFFLDMILLIIHEFGHFIVTKAVGGESVIRISHRYIDIVAETESYHLAVVPKPLRYFIYIAGIVIDLIVIATIYWIFYLSSLFQINLGILYHLFLTIILLEILSIVWEYSVFLETDIYNFLSEFLNSENLIDNAKKFFATHAKRFIPKPFRRGFFDLLELNHLEAVDDFRTFSKSEKSKLLIFYLVFIIGLVFVTIQYIFYILPTDVTFITAGIADLTHAWINSDIILIIKAIFFLLLTTYQYFILFYLKMKRRVKASPSL